MSDRSVRLFFGVAVPEPQLRALREATARLAAELRTARWLALEDQHVTMKFLGWTRAALTDAIVEAGRAAVDERGAWTTSLTELGTFPNARRARVLWAGLDDPDEALGSLAAAIDAAVEPLGFEAEARAFTPHLTLARFKTPARAPVLPGLPEAARAPFTVDELRLYRSHLSPRGARYEVVERVPIGGGRKA